MKLIKTSYAKVGNARSLLVVGMFLHGAQKLSLRQNIVLMNGKSYTFTCTVPVELQTRYAPAFDQMLHSVRWSR